MHNRVNLDFRVIVTYNVGSSTAINVLLWGRMLIAGKSVHVWIQGVYGNAILSVQFCYETKTSLKNKGVYEMAQRKHL